MRTLAGWCGYAREVKGAADLLAGRSPFEVMLYLNLVFLVTGMFIDPNSTVIVLTPIVYPAAMQLGMDPVHVGIVVVCALAIGFQTPPLGENLFVASGIGGSSIEEISLKALPFAAASVFALFLIAYFPALSLWLPGLLGY